MSDASISMLTTELAEKHRLGAILYEALCLMHGEVCTYYGASSAHAAPTTAVFAEEIDLFVHVSLKQRAAITKAVEEYAKMHDLSAFGGNRPSDTIRHELEQGMVAENAVRIRRTLEHYGIVSDIRRGKHPRIASSHIVVDMAQPLFTAKLEKLWESVAEKVIARAARLPSDLAAWADGRIPKRADHPGLPLSPTQAAEAITSWIQQLMALARDLKVDGLLTARLAPAATPKKREREAA